MKRSGMKVDSSALLERVVRKAFKAGQNWAECYVSWFKPGIEDTEARIRKAVRRAKRQMRYNNSVSGSPLAASTENSMVGQSGSQGG